MRTLPTATCPSGIGRGRGPRAAGGTLLLLLPEGPLRCQTSGVPPDLPQQRPAPPFWCTPVSEGTTLGLWYPGSE